MVSRGGQDDGSVARVVPQAINELESKYRKLVSTHILFPQTKLSLYSGTQTQVHSPSELVQSVINVPLDRIGRSNGGRNRVQFPLSPPFISANWFMRERKSHNHQRNLPSSHAKRAKHMAKNINQHLECHASIATAIRTTLWRGSSNFPSECGQCLLLHRSSAIKVGPRMFAVPYGAYQHSPVDEATVFS